MLKQPGRAFLIARLYLMQTRKHTAWKKNRKFGDVWGGRTFPKLADKVFNRKHSLTAPADGEPKPLYIVDNPSRDFYFPVTIEDIKGVLAKLPVDQVDHLTHIWLQKIKKADHMNGDALQGSFICGSGVYLIVLHPFPVNNRMLLGKEKPTRRILNYYKQYTTQLLEDKNGWYLQWTEETIRSYYLESLLLHEIGHSIDSFYYKHWSKAATKRNEHVAENYVALWANTVRTSSTVSVVKDGQ